MTYDSRRGRVLLHSDAMGQYDLWEYDGSDWKKVSTTGSVPGPRTDHAMAFDPVRNRVVLYADGETYELDPSTSVWSLRVPASGTHPAALDGFAMVYASTYGATLLMGGEAAGAEFRDVWHWNGTTWTKAAAGSTTDATRPAMVWDAHRTRLVAFGGKTKANILSHTREMLPDQTWDNRYTSSWPVARLSTAAASDGVGNTYLLSGYASGTPNDFWRWNGESWTSLTAPTFPFNGVWQSSATWDTSTNSFFVFFGQRNGDANATDQVWRYRHSGSPQWTQIAPVAPAIKPTGRMASPVAFSMAPAATRRHYRQLTYADLPQVIAIERRAFPTPWSLAMFVLELSKPSGICLAAQVDGGMVGYLVCSRYDTVWHLMNVAVDPTMQRRGIASALLDRLFELGDRPSEQYTLEVRTSNDAAIKLYERFGFRAAGRRRAYYHDNREDALIMWRTAPERATA